MFSQSRTKALRSKLRNEPVSGILEKGSYKNKGIVNKNIWDSDSLKGNNREITETVFSTEIHSVKHQRSSNLPVTLSYNELGANSLNSIGGAGGSEVVVFDDIGDDNSWRKKGEEERKGLSKGKESVSSSPSPPSYHRTPSDFFKVLFFNFLRLNLSEMY